MKHASLARTLVWLAVAALAWLALATIFLPLHLHA